MEVAPYLQEFEIDNLQFYSKHPFQKHIKRKIRNWNKSKLLNEARKYKKISPEMLSKEKFGIHENFRTLSMSQSRLRFRLSAHMTPFVAMCYKSERKNMEMGYQCVACREAGGAYQ